MAAAEAGASSSGDSVDLINKNNARRVLLGFLEHVPHAGCADTDEHLDKVRTGNRKERHAGFTGNSFGK